MSQALSNLAVGSKVKFGSYSVNGEAAQPIVWTIVAKNHTGYPGNSVTLHTSEIIDLRCFDAKEPNNSNSDRQSNGNNRYSVSNIDQWLNKDAASGEWYSAAHSADHSPDNIAGSNSGTQYANHSGFLSGFTNDEKAAILPTTIRVVKPSEDGGSYEDIIRKVFLPSTTEVGLSNEHSIAEGKAWGYYKNNTARIGYITEQCYDHTIASSRPATTTAWYWWLRTPYYSSLYQSRIVFSTGVLHTDNAYNGNTGIRPVLNLSNTLKVSDFTDGDDCYFFLWQSAITSIAWVGGTETYMENETRNVEVSMESTDDILTSDRQDELWDCKNYYENDSTGHNNHANFHNSSHLGMRFVGRLFTSNYIGTVITTKITFLKAIPNVKISKVRWSNWVEYYKNDTTLETDTIKLNDAEVYTITATKEQYGSDGNGVIIARDITIGNISVGDVLSFETKKEGTIDSTSVYNDLVEGLAFSFSSDPITLTETVPVQKTRGVNKPISSIYAGVTATVPVYTETTITEDIALSSATFTDFFSADNTGTTGTNAKGITWTNNSSGGLKLTFGNYGINSSTSMTTFTAQRDLTNVVIKGLYYTETRYDKITLTVAGTTVLNAVSGTSSTLTQRWTGSLSKGQTIVLKYVKDSSASASNESSTYFTLSCDPYQKTTTTQTQTGTETKLVDKKIIKGYVGGPDGKARLFFGSGGFSYTGEYIEQDYTDSSGAIHKIYTIITSGNLTLPSNTKFSIWGCGGGAGGQTASSTSAMAMQRSGAGGGGGYVIPTTHLQTGVIDLSIIIGAGGAKDTDGGETSCNGLTVVGAGGKSYYSAPNGGSGGGGGVSGYINDDNISITNYKGGTGKGVSTFPFDIVSLKAHCAGGAGGQSHLSYYDRSSSGSDNYYYQGGDGGTNGGNGNMGSSSGYFNDIKVQPKGGTYGGGNGGWCDKGDTYLNGENASFYGCGGGGGALSVDSNLYVSYSPSIGNGGAGYQGVVYIAIPPITTT